METYRELENILQGDGGCLMSGVVNRLIAEAFSDMRAAQVSLFSFRATEAACLHAWFLVKKEWRRDVPQLFRPSRGPKGGALGTHRYREIGEGTQRAVQRSGLRTVSNLVRAWLELKVFSSREEEPWEPISPMERSQGGLESVTVCSCHLYGERGGPAAQGCARKSLPHLTRELLVYPRVQEVAAAQPQAQLLQGGLAEESGPFSLSECLSLFLRSL